MESDGGNDAVPNTNLHLGSEPSRLSPPPFEETIAPTTNHCTLKNIREKGNISEDPYAELKRVGFKVYDQTQIEAAVELRKAWNQFGNEEELSLLRMKFPQGCLGRFEKEKVNGMDCGCSLGPRQ